MKAIRFHAIGGPEVLRFEDVELPPPGAGELRLRHEAVALNFRDILVRRGQHAVKSLPSGIGLESAGVVEAIGPQVTGFAVGDRVVCVAGPDSAYAEARNVPAARAVKLPGGIDARTAASMMIRGMTARYLLHATYRVKPGDTILVEGLINLPLTVKEILAVVFFKEIGPAELSQACITDSGDVWPAAMFSPQPAPV